MDNKDTRTFKVNQKIERKKVGFTNRYGIMLAGDLYLPEGFEAKKNPAIIVSGPFGAVKEQASGLYAQEMASRGFVSMAFDPSDKKIEEVLTRSLGIQNIALYDEKIFESTDDYYMENKEEIFKKSEKTRRNYCKYIENCEINPNEKYLFCDLISHGTVQYGLNQLFAKPLHGFYLCRIFGIYDDLEFHSCYQQGVGSEIANPEYVNFLESILTSPESSVEDMDENGNPVMAAEIRTSAELKTVQCIQEGIEEFSLDYMRTLYIKEQAIIEKLPETLLKMCKEVYFTGECKDIKKRKLYEDMHGVYYDIFEENDE